MAPPGRSRSTVSLEAQPLPGESAEPPVATNLGEPVETVPRPALNRPSSGAGYLESPIATGDPVELCRGRPSPTGPPRSTDLLITSRHTNRTIRHIGARTLVVTTPPARPRFARLGTRGRCMHWRVGCSSRIGPLGRVGCRVIHPWMSECLRTGSRGAAGMAGARGQT